MACLEGIAYPVCHLRCHRVFLRLVVCGVEKSPSVNFLFRLGLLDVNVSEIIDHGLGRLIGFCAFSLGFSLLYKINRIGWVRLYGLRPGPVPDLFRL